MSIPSTTMLQAAELMASMSSTEQPVPTPGCAGSSIYKPEKCAKTPLICPVRQFGRNPCTKKGLRKNFKTSTWNWIVSDLVRSPLRRTLSWGKKGKTSTTSTTTNNWTVDVLLRNPLQRGEGYDRRHFNQLFHQLRLANRCSQRDVYGQDLGHFDSLLRIR